MGPRARSCAPSRPGYFTERGSAASLIHWPPRQPMRAQHVAVIGVTGLAAVLTIGCSRMTATEQAEVRQSFGLPADMPLKDLGAVELRVGIPKRVSAGWGKECTVTATVLTNGSVQLDLLYESRGEVINGVKTRPYSERTRVVLPPRLLARAMQSKGWLCFPPMRPHFVVAMRPIVIP